MKWPCGRCKTWKKYINIVPLMVVVGNFQILIFLFTNVLMVVKVHSCNSNNKLLVYQIVTRFGPNRVAADMEET